MTFGRWKSRRGLEAGANSPSSTSGTLGLTYRDHMTRLLAAVLALVLVPGAACSSAAEPDDSSPQAVASTTASSSEPTDAAPSASSATNDAAGKAVGLKVTKLATGLDHPWDVHPIG